MNATTADTFQAFNADEVFQLTCGLMRATKWDLGRTASYLKIAGRSSMTKAQLASAIAATESTQRINAKFIR